jgi:hypothetical protein
LIHREDIDMSNNFKGLNEFLNDEERFHVVDLTGIMELDEDAGTLTGLTRHLKNVITGKSAHRNDSLGGEHSGVEGSGKIPHRSALHGRISDAMKKGHTAVVFKDGEPVGAVQPTTDYNGRVKANVHTATDRETRTTSTPIRGTGRMVGSTYVPQQYHKREEPDFNKTDAIHRLSHSTVPMGAEDEKSQFKDHNIEVKTYSNDPQRIAKMGERSKIWPGMQVNYIHAPHMPQTGYNKDISSKTPAGDMSHFKDSAAHRLAQNALGSSETPHATAKNLHAEIGQHLDSGDVKAAREAMGRLDYHIQRKGLTQEHPDVDRYADSLKSGMSSWGKRERARMRGEKETEEGKKSGYDY